MELKTYFAQDRAGNVVPSATVAIYLTGTNTLATGLLDVNNAGISNPFTADANGKIQFKAADGIYDMVISYGSQTGPRVTIQCIDLAGQVSAAEQAVSDAESARDQTQQIINDAGDQSTLVVLAQSTGAGKSGFSQTAVYDQNTVGEKLQRIVTPEDFRDANSAAGDWTTAIQAAINSGAREIYFPGNQYLVRPQTHAGLSGTFGANSVCINIRSNLRLFGPGVVKLMDGKGGSSGAIFGNWDGLAVENIIIELTIDGNKANSTGTTSGIVIVNATNCKTTEKTRVVNSKFNGIQFAKGSTGCKVDRSVVEGAAYIGVQLQKANNFSVSRCRVVGSGDNAYDVEANNSSMFGEIVGNYAETCNTGIFLESGGNILVTQNHVVNFNTSGIYLNRINTGSYKNIITQNRLYKGTGNGSRGCIGLNNAVGRSIIKDNICDGADYAIWIEGGVDAIVCESNDCFGIGKALVHIGRTTNALVKSMIGRNYYTGAKNGLYPYSCSPLGNTANFADRDYRSSVAPALFLETNTQATSADAEYINTTGVLAVNPAWSGAYAVYTSGDTLVYTTTNIGVGKYVLINGVYYQCTANPSGGVWMIKDANGASGNFVSAVNSAYSWTSYHADWMTL